MDETLKELKQIRQETESRFRAILEKTDEERSRYRNEIREIREAISGLPAESREQMRKLLERILALLEGCLNANEHLTQGLREMMALDNARCAELARQLTVLPFERMDLILGEFEKRLEILESMIERLQRK